jgi:hypothetical protein
MHPVRTAAEAGVRRIVGLGMALALGMWIGGWAESRAVDRKIAAIRTHLEAQRAAESGECRKEAHAEALVALGGL